MKSFTTVRRGLDPAEVEQYIRELEATLSKKDQQLADYQKKENAITKAVVDAQLTAATVIKTANDEAEKLKQDAAAELEDVKQKATALRQKLIAFQQEYNRIWSLFAVRIWWRFLITWTLFWPNSALTRRSSRRFRACRRSPLWN